MINDSKNSNGSALLDLNIKTLAMLLGVFALIACAVFYFRESSIQCRLQKSSTQMSICSLESAVEIFYLEYGAIPDVESPVTTDSPQGLKLLTILLGLEEKSAKAMNPRSIKFLNVREGDNKRNGLIWQSDGKSVAGLYDEWGNAYTVVLDTNYDEHLRFTIGSRTIDLKGRRSSVFSPGRDGVLGNRDDVNYW